MNDNSYQIICPLIKQKVSTTFRNEQQFLSLETHAESCLAWETAILFEWLGDETNNSSVLTEDSHSDYLDQMMGLHRGKMLNFRLHIWLDRL